MNRTVSLLLIAGMFLLLCGCGKGSAAQMEADSGTSLSSEQEHMPVDLQRLACIEVYAADGFLITTIDDYNALARFVDGFTGNMDHWSQDYFSSDLNLPGDTLYCFVVYKAPAARINDGTLDVNMEITLFVDSDIVQFLFYPSGNEAQYFPGGVRFYQESTPDFLHFLTTLAENPDETAGAQSRERNSGVPHRKIRNPTWKPIWKIGFSPKSKKTSGGPFRTSIFPLTVLIITIWEIPALQRWRIRG